MSSIPTSAMPHAYSPPEIREPDKQPGVLSLALGLAFAPVFIGVGLTALAMSAVIGGFGRQPASSRSLEEVPV